MGVGAGGLELAGTTAAQIDMVVGSPRGMLVAGVLASAPIAWAWGVSRYCLCSGEGGGGGIPDAD